MTNHTSAMEVSIEQADFIPYACHLDEATLLTKNGEVMQILKIEGYLFDTLQGARKTDIRTELRQIFQQVAIDPHFCASFHIVRRRRNLKPTASVVGMFAGEVENKWVNAHRWQEGYSNDLYITLLHEGGNFTLKNIGQLFRSFFFMPEKMSQRRQLEHARDRLTQVADQFLAALTHYKARKLKAIDEGEAFYSEPLSLLNHLINLEHGRKMPMPVADISDYLVSYPVDVGFNTLEVRHPSGSTRHASIYSIKQYSEMSAATLDAFMQFPGEFIITQQVMLGARPEFVQKLEYKKHMAELGDDKDFLRFSSIEDLLSSNKGQWSDYSMQQNTVMILANSAAQLETMSGAFTAALGSVGIVVVREDVMLEQVYYSQLPGNFEFLKRQKPINTSRIAGYATLYDFPTGKLRGNKWGPAISVLKTTQKNPYFFSFHQGTNGHTLIAGPYGAGKTRLLNFLMAQAERVEPHVIWIDTHRSGEMMIRAMGGGYMQLTRNKETPRRPMNPLKLPDTPENRKFLEQWLKLLLLDLDGNLKADPGVNFAEVVKAIYALPLERRQISRLSLSLPEPLTEYFQQWIGAGRYGHLFDNAQDETLIEGRRIEGFDLTEMVQDRRPLWATLSYLLHRAQQSLNGKQTIFVFDEAWTLFDNPVFGTQLAGFLDQLQQQNAVAILATESMDDLPLSHLTAQIIGKIGTRLLFPYNDVTQSFQNLMGLTPEQYKQFLSMEKEQRQVFLQQGTESVVVDMQLPLSPGILNILEGKPAQVTRMENTIARAGTLPEQWLPEFYKQPV